MDIMLTRGEGEGKVFASSSDFLESNIVDTPDLALTLPDGLGSKLQEKYSETYDAAIKTGYLLSLGDLSPVLCLHRYL